MMRGCRIEKGSFKSLFIRETFQFHKPGDRVHKKKENTGQRCSLPSFVTNSMTRANAQIDVGIFR